MKMKHDDSVDVSFGGLEEIERHRRSRAGRAELYSKIVGQP